MISDTILLLVLLPALLIAWKDANARWLMMTLLGIQIIDMSMYQVAITWVHHYYLWCLALNLLFIIVVLGRKQWAGAAYSCSKLPFFKEVILKYNLTTLECALILMYMCSGVVCALVWVEVQLYSFKVITTPYLYHYVFTVAQSVIHTLEILAVASYITRLRDQLNNGALYGNH
ncbi:hypothetical protein C3B51_16190 [Pseudoalteromonas rubra]|uniref:Uncharacterized protein n=1 Tax=Pseudoalteromonas rubra TaxID=43658 RepID=A0A4V2E2A5_9GAMM|nr:hypothetical protein C3B51_16190 [Pseudoalteromonas rubra]